MGDAEPEKDIEVTATTTTNKEDVKPNNEVCEGSSGDATKSTEPEASAEKHDDNESVEEKFGTPEGSPRKSNEREQGNEDEELNAGEENEDLDDDEREDNPAFIPKRGKYYMHDSRDPDGDEEEEDRRKSRADGAWKHDRFDERYQRPKSKKQLQNKYGFDIRVDEDGEEIEEGIRNISLDKDTTIENQPIKKTPPRKIADQNGVEEPIYPEDEMDCFLDLLNGGRRGYASERKLNDSSENYHSRSRRDEDEVESDEDNHQERAGTRRTRGGPAPRRGVRGGYSRGRIRTHSNRGGYQHGPSRDDNRDRYVNDRDDRGGGRPQRGYRDDRDGEQREFQNHRRGVMRGAVRGPIQNAGPRQYTRTFSNSSNQKRFDRNDNNSRVDRDEDAPRYQSTQRTDRPNYPVTRGGYTGRAIRGHSYRGGSGGFSARGSGPPPMRGRAPDMGPKRYSDNRGPAGPIPFPNTAVPPPDRYAPNPQLRQPTNVVYFDPSRQPPPPARVPLQPREKKIMEIVPPPS